MKISPIFEDLQNIWYHGSNNRFDTFDNVNNRTYKEIDIPSWYFTKNKEYAKSYGKYLYTVKLLIKNTFDTSNPKHMKIFVAQLKEFGYDNEKINDILGNEFVNDLPYWTNNDSIYIAAANGFDSILVQEELETDVPAVSVFKNEKIQILNITS